MKSKLKKVAPLLLAILFASTLLACPAGHNHQINEYSSNQHVATLDSCEAIDCGESADCVLENYENPHTGTFDERPACILED